MKILLLILGIIAYSHSFSQENVDILKTSPTEEKIELTFTSKRDLQTIRQDIFVSRLVATYSAVENITISNKNSVIVDLDRAKYPEFDLNKFLVHFHIREFNVTE